MLQNQNATNTSTKIILCIVIVTSAFLNSSNHLIELDDGPLASLGLVAILAYALDKSYL